MSILRLQLSCLQNNSEVASKVKIFGPEVIFSQECAIYDNVAETPSS